MEKMHFKISIKADRAKVYDIMLGEDTFKLWAAVFNPTSDYEGSWEKGAKIRFIGVNKEGKKEGMVGMIRENIPNQFVSIEYIALLDDDKEITEGPMTQGWLNAFENYSFEENNGETLLTVDIDINDSMVEYFEKTYPAALAKLKEICED